MGTRKVEKTLLDLLAEKHNDWLSMAKSFSDSMSLESANDLVQDMYLRLYKYVKDPDVIMYGNEINTLYIYRTLQNLYVNTLKESNKVDRFQNGQMFNKIEDEDEMDVMNELARIELEDRILEEINGWRGYDSKLFKLVYYDEISMRQLSRDTNISVSSIFNTIKKSREIIRVKFEDDFNKLKD